LSAEVIDLAARRALASATPNSARFTATTTGLVALEVVLGNGDFIDVVMDRTTAARLILQGTDALEMAEELARG
jgi:hypothetical protein